MMLVDMTIKEFLAEITSDSPAPGGGSAAALAGAVGAALAAMVGNLTLGNAKYEDAQAEVQSIVPHLNSQQVKLEQYIDEDTAVFNKVMAAYRLPKATDDEKLARSQAIQQALKAAAALPMDVAERCCEVLVLSKRMLAIGNANAASDAAVAGRMAHTAMWAAIYNVRINLDSIKDQDFVAEMKEQIKVVTVKGEAALNELLAETDRKISV
mgnify:CR=1 FL=1